MKKVKDLDDDTVAAIGNSSSGKLYGLQPIQGNIANQTENHTRFIVVARKPVEVSTQIPAKTTLIMFNFARSRLSSGNTTDSSTLRYQHD